MHEEYQEICAAAGIGQAAPEELARLHEHLPQCGTCRRTYSEFTNFAAQHFIHDLGRKGILPEEERQLPDAALLKRRLLQRAAEKGFFASDRSGRASTEYQLSAFGDARHPMLQWLGWKPAIGAVVALTAVLASILCAYEVGTQMSSKVADTTHSQTLSKDKVAIAAGVGSDLTAVNGELQVEVARLKNDLRTNEGQLRTVRERLESTTDDKQRLVAERAKLETTAAELQRRLTDAEGLLQAKRGELAKLQEQAAKLKSEAADARATYIADQIKMRELGEELADKTAAVERNGQLLQRDRDIRDLMTARNLHIFDVFDTDAKGKTRPAFGRIFYTEGKSLVFYAYDLNDAKVQNANYHYRVWGSQEAQKDKMTSLGVFYSDDKSQRRWVFKCDDPKILSQIDSVFVTLEPAGSGSLQPKGQKLLDAYLGGLANHP
jgi:predicted  nucleic acid-binding Zn-ribbon protein